MEGVYLVWVWGVIGEWRNFLFYFHIERLQFFLFFFAFRNIPLNLGIFSPSESCNSGSQVSVFKDLAFPKYFKASLIPRNASLCL